MPKRRREREILQGDRKRQRLLAWLDYVLATPYELLSYFAHPFRNWEAYANLHPALLHTSQDNRNAYDMLLHLMFSQAP